MRRGLLILALAAAFPAAAHAGTVFVVDGRGFGHGIGMSQYGAEGYARHGWGHERILAHYYRGTRLSTLSGRKVRVLLAEGRWQVAVASAKPFRRGSARLKPGTRALTPKVVARLGGTVRFRPGAAPLELDGNGYRGDLVVHVRNGKLAVVNELSLERYLRGVVPWEMPSDWHAEALQAQAVVARSYALATLKPGKDFDLYADVRSQVYGGIRAEEDTTNRAVGATAGRVVTYGGRVATTFYHSTSGGRTSSIQAAWPKADPTPYLVSVPDPYDAISKHHRWGPITLTNAQLAHKLGMRGVKDVSVRGVAGRATWVVVKGARGTRTFEANDFRRRTGLRSTWITLRAMALDPPIAAAIRNRRVKLSGWVRGLSGVRIERKVAPGSWQPVARVRPRPNGRFTAVVPAVRAAEFRLAARGAAGAAVTLRRG
jgi:stage II sporulation protein D